MQLFRASKFALHLVVLGLLIKLMSVEAVANIDGCEPSTDNAESIHKTSPINIPQIKTIKRIDIVRQSIFDTSNPDENNYFFRMANRLHYTTKESVIRQQLLIQEGDIYDIKKIKESERILRSNRYLDDVKIVESVGCDHHVILQVVTRDLWTLSPELSFSRSGGDNNTTVGFQDTNFLGTGKDVWIVSKKNEERTSKTVAYQDKQLLGTRMKLLTKYANNSDGKQQQYELVQPFYAFDSRRAYGLTHSHFIRNDGIYLTYKEDYEVNHDEETNDIFYGWSDGIINNNVYRWLVGFSWRRHDYALVDTALAVTPPEDQEVNFPWLELSKTEDSFTQLTNLYSLHRTEDFFVGRAWRVRLGWADETFGSDQDRLIMDSDFTETLLNTENNLMQVSFRFGTYWNKDTSSAEDLDASARFKYFNRSSSNTQNIFGLDIDIIKNASGQRQLLLEGDSDTDLNLRGYPSHFQFGDRRMVFSYERRFYTHYHVLNLFYLAGAVFLDIGRAWHSENVSDTDTIVNDMSDGTSVDNAMSEDRTSNSVLADIGFGFRLSPSRSHKSKMLHLDFAVPLRERDLVDSFQFSVEFKEVF